LKPIVAADPLFPRLAVCAECDSKRSEPGGTKDQIRTPGKLLNHRQIPKYIQVHRLTIPI
jgi:hypothetical protein